MKLLKSALLIAVLGHASGALAAPIFSSDLESGTLDSIFYDVNSYEGVQVSLSTEQAHSGSRAVKIVYPRDEAGVELKPAAFPATKSLYIRKYEYFGPGWEGNWPVGLKTSRYFTRPDFSYGSDGSAYAYMSEKLIWQTYSGSTSDQYARGLCMAVYNQDIEATYASSTLFGNNLPYIRTGHWYKMETWLVLNSGVDVADGVMQVWIDDKLVLDRKNVVWKSSSRGVPNGTGWQSMWFGGNYSGAVFGGPGTSVSRYIDDLYLSTTLDRSSGPTPRAPANLSVQ
ncbi:hypothetical protein GCM10011487_41570 [Steroidobacter agaridevorans]|uniref:Polysaccharide lyase n=1 Tax=Steroidobacter agaridevorans TaxID=2695856 RepID=A0A829YFP0_9GAMM|nr:hypothetical protein [Steroidobacter agaridevorans]GFE82157.1 hypothetical protein GCM10011487_41570 [Steroidobacter agaridevorans]GFE85455.1 hypothetical protein GCM10011488_04090 [Steroidobacter agaridevorans]